MTKKQKRNLRNIIIAGVLFFVLVAFEIIMHHVLKKDINRFIMLIIYLVPYFIVGFPVVRKAVIGIKNKSMLDESFLMTIATIGAFATGENMEACAVMLFYQIGEFFQQYAVNRSRKSIKDLMDIAPEIAIVQRENGEMEELFPDEVNIGDIIVVKPGEKIPVDGEVISGESMINTSNLTGESVPRKVGCGDKIISGCINGEGLLKYKAEKKYEDSTVARILELVENASEKKSKTENFITRFARVYTPIVVVLALILAIVPSIVTKNPMLWIYRACTFLVISCPCALVISVPLSFFGGIGAASKHGVLVKGSNFLELLTKMDTLVCDKTGTLTKGIFKVTRVKGFNKYSENDCLKYASYVEKMSSHPIADSIVRACKERKIETDDMEFSINNISGCGLIGEADKLKIYVGNDKLMSQNGFKIETEEYDGKSTICYVGIEKEGSDKEFVGVISISDVIKEEAYDAIKEIKNLGVKQVIMLTGDTKEVGESVAAELKLDKVYTSLLPQEKVSSLEEIITKSDKNAAVAFIGDGINDAPVLSRADLGIAMGSMGSDAAIEAADVVILDDRLSHIPAVIKIAKKTVSISKQNIIFALLVKVITLALGALGIAGIWAAVFADVGVAVICILNSMRMLREGNKNKKRE